MATPKRRNPKRAGRKTKYIAALHPNQAKSLFALGFEVGQYCDHIGICRDTFYAWKKKHPEFSDMIDLGKSGAVEKVVSAVFEKAIGRRTVQEQQVTESATGDVVTKTTKKQLPPDMAAAKFYLTNRDPENWRNNADTGEQETRQATPVDIHLTVAPAKGDIQVTKGGEE